MSATENGDQYKPDVEPVVPTPLIFTFDNDRKYDPQAEVPILLSRAQSLSLPSFPGMIQVRLEDRHSGAALANRVGAYLDCIESGRPGLVFASSQYGNSVEVVDTPTTDNKQFNLKDYSGTLRRTSFFPQARQVETIPASSWAIPEVMISNINGITIGMGNRGDTANYDIHGTLKNLTWQTFCDSTSSYKATTKFDPETGEINTTYIRAYDPPQELTPGDGFMRYYWDKDSTRMMRCLSTGIVYPTNGVSTVLRCEFESYDDSADNEHKLDIVEAPVQFPSDIFPRSPDDSHMLGFEEYQKWIQSNWQRLFPVLQQRQTVIKHTRRSMQESDR